MGTKRLYKKAIAALDDVIQNIQYYKIIKKRTTQKQDAYKQSLSEKVWPFEFQSIESRNFNKFMNPKVIFF